jgi:hypothetical protein
VVGLGLGSVFGLKANSTNKDSKKSCDPNNANSCSRDGVSKRDDARTQGNVSTVSFIAGGALLAAAVVAWRVEVGGSKQPDASNGTRLRASAAILPGSAAMYLQGEF